MGLGQPLDRYGDFARQIVASHPDVILPINTTIIKEINALGTGIPIVAQLPIRSCLAFRRTSRGLTEISPGWSLMQGWKSGGSAFNYYWKPHEK